MPRELKIAWTADAGRPARRRPIAEDWRQNYFIRGPVGPPVVAGGSVYVARPDAHQVVALDATSGNVRWTFTANGRVDTAPTIHRGLCLFGCKSGWVYCLRADDGGLVWRLRAAPLDERIVAYGQIESPWPVPGSVLVVDDVAYFAAGRQSLADGGIRVFCRRAGHGQGPLGASGSTACRRRQFYACSGLEFDNFDLLHREGDAVAMSRWLFDRTSGEMTCAAKIGFARLATGGSGGVMFPRGAWSYAPRNETERSKERPFLRPLAVFARQHALLLDAGPAVAVPPRFRPRRRRAVRPRVVPRLEHVQGGRQRGRPVAEPAVGPRREMDAQAARRRRQGAADLGDDSGR